MNHLGFTESHLKKMWTSNEYELFIKFMYGQTFCQVGGENTFYYEDVQNFCAQYHIQYPVPDKEN